MKLFYILILLFSSFLVFSQDQSLKELLAELNNTKILIKQDFKLSGNILESKLKCKNYYFSTTNNDTLCLFGLKKISNFIFFLPVWKISLANNFKDISLSKKEIYGFIAPSDLLIFDAKKNEFFYVNGLAGGATKLSKKGIEYDLYFEVIIPIAVLDNNFYPKYYFFDTEEDGEQNLAYCEFIWYKNYFQMNSFAQKERKVLNVLGIKLNDLEMTCKEETVLVKKQFFTYKNLDIFNIYDQIRLRGLEEYHGSRQ